MHNFMKSVENLKKFKKYSKGVPQHALKSFS